MKEALFVNATRHTESMLNVEVNKESPLHMLISYLSVGSLIEMEKLAKETEVASSYTMNTEVASDTEEWHRHKSTTNKNIQPMKGYLICFYLMIWLEIK